MPVLHARFLVTRRPSIVAPVRHRILAQVLVWGSALDADARSSLELVVSELVTNAVLHADGLLITIGLHLDQGRLLLEVLDGSAHMPRDRLTASDQDEFGRGMELVAALAHRHGWEPTRHGKRVWAELLVPEPPEPSARTRLLQRAVLAARPDPQVTVLHFRAAS
ncbi:ATP-binding protein [Streptacidiphilus sp. PAMC 29251]